MLNLVTKEQFSSVSADDAASHLNNFVDLCDMQKYTEVEGDIIKLKGFPFSLRGHVKYWLLSLPRNSMILGLNAKMPLLGNIIHLQKLYN